MKVYDNTQTRPFFAQFTTIKELASAYPRIEDLFTAFSVADVGVRDTRPHNNNSLLRTLGRLDWLSTRTIQQVRPGIGRQWASKLASVCGAISMHSLKYLKDAKWFDDPLQTVDDFEHLASVQVTDAYETLIHRLNCGNISEAAYDQAILDLIEAEYA
jgi:hypothetical protein|tara:strand:+ start:525 stop:998 length:474 start_codon:yes stop_codon:yes gene_type:complete